MMKSFSITNPWFSNILLSLMIIVGVLVPLLIPQPVSAQVSAGFLNCSGVDCSACNLVYTANRVIVWLVGILFIVFAILMVRAGFNLVISGGNSGAVSDAKSSFINAIIGLLILLSAWLIIDTLMRGLGVQNLARTGPLPWSEVQCQIQTAVYADPPAAPGEDAASTGATPGTTPGGTTGAGPAPRGTAATPIQAAEVRSILSAQGVAVQSGVQSLDGLDRARVEEVASLAQRCAQAMGQSCGVQVSSGVRTAGNASGVGAHGTGNAIDLSARSATFNQWMMTQSGYTQVASFNGYSGYRSPSGNTVCTWESRGDMDSPGAHWHCAP